MNEFAQFEALLNQEMGLDARSVGSAMIERAVRERCAVRDAPDIDAYWRDLKVSPAELQELIELVIVPETWFFRDSAAFSALARLALSHPMRPARRLRLLSLPCSTGEEPYSMAMALLDAGMPPASFHIDAVDICTRSIAKAQRALYSSNSFRGKDLQFRQRYFAPVGERHALAESVRSQVRFCHGNLFDPALLADEGDYDFVFCRNVLIYFGDAEQARAVQVLGRLLDDTGVLFVGPSEGGVLVRENMAPANMPLTFAFRKAPPASPQPNSVLLSLQSARSRLAAQAAPAGLATRRPVAAPARPVRDRGQDQASPAPRRVSAAPASAAAAPAGPVSDPLALAAQLADQGRLMEAAAICQRHVQEHKPSAAAFYLLGLVSDAAGHHAEAREHYRKALYLDPTHTEAMLHLAAVLEMQGDLAGAERMNDRARRAITKVPN